MNEIQVAFSNEQGDATEANRTNHNDSSILLFNVFLKRLDNRAVSSFNDVLNIFCSNAEHLQSFFFIISSTPVLKRHRSFVDRVEDAMERFQRKKQL